MFTLMRIPQYLRGKQFPDRTDATVFATFPSKEKAEYVLEVLADLNPAEGR
jgi:hypothetical protein